METCAANGPVYKGKYLLIAVAGFGLRANNEGILIFLPTLVSHPLTAHLNGHSITLNLFYNLVYCDVVMGYCSEIN